MSDSGRPDVRAFHELEQLVRHLGEELATFRRRAIQAEAMLKDGGGGGADAPSMKGAGGERLAALEAENAALRARLTHVEERVTRMLDRVRFIRQQAQLQPARMDAADAREAS